MRQLTVSIGGKHNARVVKTWRGSFDDFVKSLLSKVLETSDKASNGWVCATEFSTPWRDSENFVARHLLSFDYDHVAVGDLPLILECYKKYAYFAFTTWSHTPEKPRLRLWVPLSRSCSYDEFQALSRLVAAEFDIEKMARESHVPCQYYFRPSVKPFDELQTWRSDAPWLEVDAKLAEYADWTDRKQWPHRAEADGVHNEGETMSPLDKRGVVGGWCRAFSIEEAIERFDLPYDKVR